MPARWYSLTEQEVVERLKTDLKKGLTDREVKERAARFGPNELLKAPKTPPWVLFLNQFKDFMVLVLLAATAVSGFLGEYADAVTIMIIVAVNAVLGFVQEYRAERSLEALKKLTSPEARVFRDGQERRVRTVELVPGDIVVLEEGDRVPADLRLLKTSSLEIEESALTGESLPVPKVETTLSGQDLALGDTFNMAYLGTVVTRGRGSGIVVHTGMATEMGQIAGMIQEAGQETTPLQRRLSQLGRWLVSFCLLICAVVVVVGILRGEEAYQMFLAGVSLAVAAIPEGLPAIVTVALAIGVQRMIKRNAIIRKLPAVETLGCATVICSDKTGTLTQNEMTVREVVIRGDTVEVSGEGYDPKGEFTGTVDRHREHFNLLMKAAALCNNSIIERGGISIGGLFRGLIKGRPAREWTVLGDPTEGALLVMASKAGFWREKIELKEPRESELPFDSERKRMTVVCRQPGGSLRAYVKGAPDVILDLCTHVYKNGLAVPLSSREKEEILTANAGLAEKALRVLAFAYRELPAETGKFTEELVENRLIYLGMAGMIDPPRPAAVKAVQTCRRAGIKVVMITGDHQLTARAIAGEMGILAKKDLVLTGRDLDAMPDQAFIEQVGRASVFARVSPRHKLKIVRALKQSGHVVAMTGDGVNDAPAVNEADIGVAMGITGTDVTKEASAMVLTDDNFSSIVAAIEEGRGIYDNIRKFIRYLLSCNTGEVLTMLIAMLAGLPLPLVPIQILWMNLVTDGLPAMALGVDPIDHDIMRRPPRHPRESVFSHGMAWRIVSNGTVIGLGTLVAFWIGARMGGTDLARTMAFNTIVFFQMFYVFTCRSEFHTILELGFFTNPYLVGAVLISTALQLAVDYVPFLQSIFHVVPLHGLHWAVILALSAAPTVSGILFQHLTGEARKKVMYLKV
ncbi:MAG: calcium-transporting P-type ATPase, PMR1-type [Peptococcaceae bacterium]|nr:calcium-transporting P-type ATPase, PMR1-type [Peptococcaceae bacterium]